MSKTTANFNLIKPELTDAADITQMNPNWDTIDAELKNRAKLDENGKVLEEQLPDTTFIPVTSEVPRDSDIWIDPDDVTVEEEHVVDQNNPHRVTAEQTGALSKDGGVFGDDAISYNTPTSMGYVRFATGNTSGQGAELILSGNSNGQTDYPSGFTLKTHDSYTREAKALRGTETGDLLWCESFINPEMQDGVVYKTAKRYFGKPVYATLINVGTLVGGTFTVGVANDVIDKLVTLDLTAYKTGSDAAYKIPAFGSAEGAPLFVVRKSGKRTFMITDFEKSGQFTVVAYVEYTLQ